MFKIISFILNFLFFQKYFRKQGIAQYLQIKYFLFYFNYKRNYRIMVLLNITITEKVSYESYFISSYFLIKYIAKSYAYKNQPN